MGELANHLAPGAMLNNQGVLAADSGAAGYVRHFNQEMNSAGRLTQQGHSTLDHTLLGVNFCPPEAHFIGVGNTALERARENILQLAVIAKQL
jgi:hypothetical protein